MIKLDEMRALVARCSYKPGWTIQVLDDGRPYLQLAVDETTEAALDSHVRDGTRTPWKSGKRYLSHYMCKQEIVGAVFGLIKDAETHEIHEWFRYRGASIFNPHLDPDALVTLARRRDAFNVRENAMTMMEGK